MKKRVFIDGSAGTTGLRIRERLSAREDIEIVKIDEEKRKDNAEKSKIFNSCDVVFLCLPDAAAIESAKLVTNKNTVVIDTSTAHRTMDDWTYGFPELFDGNFEKIQNSKRIAVPGCHASGFIALVAPLIENGIIDKNALLTCHSITGYSGGGKKMIAQYEDEKRESLLDAPRQYGLSQNHKHLKEMKAITGLENEPCFCPIVSDFYSGMVVSVPLFSSQLKSNKNVNDIKQVYKNKYNSQIVSYTENIDDNGFISANDLHLKDNMLVGVAGNDERILLVAEYDNLGKGASGAAIECLNIVLGAPISTGLDI